MSEQVRIAIDAMGGDNAPGEIVKGAIEACNECGDIHVVLVGKEDLINAELKKYQYNAEQVEVVHAPDVVEMAESPVLAVSKKKESSLVKALLLVKSGDCDCYVSAGSTGATLVGGQVLVGRIKGVERPPLAPVIPTQKGGSLLLDCGANVDAKPKMLLQFALMGSIYMEHVMGVKNPTVGILNIGAEEEKGNQLVKETFPLLKNCPDINFVGSVEARDVPKGEVDVIVCEAFAGNVLLKMYEGVGKMFQNEIKAALKKNIFTMLGALLVKGSLKQRIGKFDPHLYGGAPLLGLKGLVVKTHGSAKAGEVKTTCKQCLAFKQQKITEKIAEVIQGKDE